MRAFIALSLPSSAQSSLASLQQSLAVSGADVTWVQPQNLHVTMKFLGEITDEQRQTIEALLRRVASGAAPFSLGLEGVGAFPSLAAPRVIWTGIAAGNDVVLRLAKAIEEGTEEASLPKEERPFSAHVTLGRVRSAKRREALSRALRDAVWTPPAPCRMSALTLYQSLLGSSGPTYTVLSEFPLP